MGLNAIPSLFTLANLAFGLLSLNYTREESYQMAAITILLCMILDGLDGRIARKLDASSNFGKELDSLADIVSFGVAPALLVYAQVLENFHWVGLISVIWFAVAGAYRLARFNTQNISGHFVGVPITAAGSFLALLNLLPFQIPAQVFLGVTLLLGILMVSKIKVPKY
ncbi:MAG: CDP-diacylglycerol--serine O-phosphatidyltransferase [Bacillota bacterium]|jgi:CDP-diacylglycerol--serine O-phosphatidyltransferase|nr:CDP-diacylglycerol--serine O-phosphatidyltransferase [Clostridia bacterium]